MNTYMQLVFAILLLTLAVAHPTVSSAQASDGYYTAAELRDLALRYTKAFVDCQRYEGSVRALRQPPKVFSRPSRDLLIFYPTQDSNYVVRSLDANNRWHDSVLLFLCLDISSIHPQSYVLAFRVDGSMCRLRGFGDPDTECLVRATAGEHVDAKEALDLGILYIQTVKFDDFSKRTIVSSTEASSLQSQFASVHAPSVESVAGKWIVRISAIWSPLRDVLKEGVTEYVFEVTDNGIAMVQDGTALPDW